ncbi:putative Zn finger-like uncharacterized protein, partial [Desulfobotulus alkaliphilus]
MIITCEACAARFQLDDHYIQPTGTKVRCARCRHVFTAFRDPEPPVSEPEDDLLNIDDIQKPLHAAPTPAIKDPDIPESPEQSFGSLPDLAPLPLDDLPEETVLPSVDIPVLPENKIGFPDTEAISPIVEDSLKNQNSAWETEPDTKGEEDISFNLDLDMEQLPEDKIGEQEKEDISFDLDLGDETPEAQEDT